MTSREHAIQSSFFELVRLYAQKDSRFGDIYATPNGGYRNKKTAKDLKDEGVMPGVLDVFVRYPSGRWHGMFIEFKRSKKEKPSEEQTKFAERSMSLGYICVLAWDAEDAFRAVRKYFDRPEYFEGKV